MLQSQRFGTVKAREYILMLIFKLKGPSQSLRTYSLSSSGLSTADSGPLTGSALVIFSASKSSLYNLCTAI